MIERTPKQKQAVREAYKLVTSEFDDVLIVCAMAKGDSVPEVFWKGGSHHVASLADCAKERVAFSKRAENKPPEEGKKKT